MISMKKVQTQYVCRECGRTNPKYMGRCPGCGGLGTMEEEIVSNPAAASAAHPAFRKSEPVRLRDIELTGEKRIDPGIGELAQVLGGGIVPGSLILIGGDPGIGKSTLLLQTAIFLAGKATVLYVSGEESERQIKMRAERILASAPKFRDLSERLLLYTETSLDAILNAVAELKPEFLIVDSIQTIQLSALESTAGSLTQVRECTGKLRELAKTSGLTVFVIGHVTKEGLIAGPRVLEHIVDTVLYLEGDRFQTLRLLRSVKNRYGATSEVGVFEMIESGLNVVKNPSELFLSERMVNASGSAIAVTMEGTRPILVEVQALTNPTAFGNPRRAQNGVDMNRLFLITAVLTRRVGLRLGDQDVYVNVVNGLKISEPAADLAVAGAIFSSARGVPLRADTVLIGEIGLSGELHGIQKLSARINEARKLGFTRAIVPRLLRIRETFPTGIEIIQARTLKDAMQNAVSDAAPVGTDPEGAGNG